MSEFVGFLVVALIGFGVIVYAARHDESKESDSDDRRT